MFADRRILQDNKKMSIINKWMPLAFPNKIKYRFLCHIESTHDDEEKEPEHSSGTASSDKEVYFLSVILKDLFPEQVYGNTIQKVELDRY